ncbi:MAG: UDP-glucose 4-epimerase GalE [Clostridia bacterium]|nr:UDP-glucose 4-epimerase GalE [Clostridia bacterium]
MILVTGGTGFIGSHTVVELIQAGYEVVIVDNLVNSKVESLDAIEKITGVRPVFYENDVCDKEALEKIFKENPIDAVIHFAGLKAVGESVSKPIEYYSNNIIGTLKLVEVMREFGCNKIVFSSSATVYGMNNIAPYTEDMPTSATNPYGQTKFMQEIMLKDIAHANPDFSVALLRYFNPIGAHESGLIGEDPNGIPNNLMPYICKVAAGKLPCLSVFGNDYDTPDGTGVRDYIHVVDLAQGHLCALKYIEEHKGVLTVNLGTGKGTSVLELVDAFEKASGVHVNRKMAPRRPGDIATCYASTEKAKELLGWEAKRTIEDMCADSWRFISNKNK